MTYSQHPRVSPFRSTKSAPHNPITHHQTTLPLPKHPQHSAIPQQAQPPINVHCLTAADVSSQPHKGSQAPGTLPAGVPAQPNQGPHPHVERDPPTKGPTAEKKQTGSAQENAKLRSLRLGNLQVPAGARGPVLGVGGGGTGWG